MLCGVSRKDSWLNWLGWPIRCRETQRRLCIFCLGWLDEYYHNWKRRRWKTQRARVKRQRKVEEEGKGGEEEGKGRSGGGRDREGRKRGGRKEREHRKESRFHGDNRLGFLCHVWDICRSPRFWTRHSIHLKLIDGSHNNGFYWDYIYKFKKLWDWRTYALLWGINEFVEVFICQGIW